MLVAVLDGEMAVLLVAAGGSSGRGDGDVGGSSGLGDGGVGGSSGLGDGGAGGSSGW